MKTSIYPVLIISYEMFVRMFDTLQQLTFDLIVCDEGHRLKNTNIKTTSVCWHSLIKLSYHYLSICVHTYCSSLFRYRNARSIGGYKICNPKVAGSILFQGDFSP